LLSFLIVAVAVLLVVYPPVRTAPDRQ
jgi:hypothetical protein